MLRRALPIAVLLLALAPPAQAARTQTCQAESTAIVDVAGASAFAGLPACSLSFQCPPTKAKPCKATASAEATGTGYVSLLIEGGGFAGPTCSGVGGCGIAATSTRVSPGLTVTITCGTVSPTAAMDLVIECALRGR